jgi:hypothetical protein
MHSPQVFWAFYSYTKSVHNLQKKQKGWHYNQHDTNYALALSPVMSKQFATIADKCPLKWEFGVGVSLINDTILQEKILVRTISLKTGLDWCWSLMTTLNHQSLCVICIILTEALMTKIPVWIF